MRKLLMRARFSLWLSLVVLLFMGVFQGVGDASSGEGPLPAEAVVKTAPGGGVWVSAAWLHGLLRRGVAAAVGWDPESVELRSVTPAGDVPLPARPVRYSWVALPKISSGRRAAIRIRLYGARGVLLQEIDVSGRILLARRVWVLSRDMRSGEILSWKDLSPQRRDLRQVPPGAVLDPMEVIGLRARRGLLAGTVLRRDQWSPPALVRRGQRVRILLETSLLRVTAPGECLEEGAKGQTVRVMNLSSRRVVWARILDGRSVRVEY